MHGQIVGYIDQFTESLPLMWPCVWWWTTRNSTSCCAAGHFNNRFYSVYPVFLQIKTSPLTCKGRFSNTLMTRNPEHMKIFNAWCVQYMFQVPWLAMPMLHIFCVWTRSGWRLDTDLSI